MQNNINMLIRWIYLYIYIEVQTVECVHYILLYYYSMDAQKTSIFACEKLLSNWKYYLSLRYIMRWTILFYLVRIAYYFGSLKY